MGALRRERSKKETTFLDMVSGQLASMNEEINDLKELVRTLVSFHIHLPNDATDEILPPPAPPPLDQYDRTFLLGFRGKSTDNHGSDSLASPIEVDALADFRLAADANLTASHNEEDEITEFLIASGNWNDEAIETRDAYLRALVTDAQRKSYTMKQREYAAIGSIQRFWKKCKSKIAKPFVSGTSSKKMLGSRRPHAGGPVDRMLESEEADYLENAATAGGGLQKQLERCDEVVDDFLGYYFDALDTQVMNLPTECISDATKLSTRSSPVHAGSCGTAMGGRVAGAVQKPEVSSVVESDRYVEAEERACLNRIYIDVPYRDKEKAKQMGAVWDTTMRKWYVGEVFDKRLIRWYPTMRLELQEAVSITHCTDCGARLAEETKPCSHCGSRNRHTHFPNGAERIKNWKRC